MKEASEGWCGSSVERALGLVRTGGKWWEGDVVVLRRRFLPHVFEQIARRVFKTFVFFFEGLVGGEFVADSSVEGRTGDSCDLTIALFRQCAAATFCAQCHR